MKKRNVFRLIWFSLVAIFFIWLWSTYQARQLPEDTFRNGSKVTVESSSDAITFLPTTPPYQHQIIFFQGGLTDPKAYAPLCRKFAENGFICHLIKMAWRMPQWDYEKIQMLFDLTHGKFIIGGHSQGAKMAAQFVYENPDVMHGLIFLGTSHPRDIDLSQRSIPTLKMYAEFDGLASVQEVLVNQDKLPAGALLTEIRGGNHSQFGYLGKLLMDGAPTITRDEQQQIILRHLIDFCQDIEMQSVHDTT